MNSRPEPERSSNQEPELSNLDKLALAQAKVDKWSRVLALPDLSPKAASLASELLRSCQAELKLRQKAMQWEQQQNALRSPQGQPTSSDQESLGSSIKPGTSESTT